jgi:hypothetical protein
MQSAAAWLTAHWMLLGRLRAHCWRRRAHDDSSLRTAFLVARAKRGGEAGQPASSPTKLKNAKNIFGLFARSPDLFQIRVRVEERRGQARCDWAPRGWGGRRRSLLVLWHCWFQWPCSQLCLCRALGQDLRFVPAVTLRRRIPFDPRGCARAAVRPNPCHPLSIYYS